MAANQTIDTFETVLAYLSKLVPPGALVQDDAPPADEEGFLDPLAQPPDPKHAAIIAVIDHAIPFAHPLFTVSGGQSRFAAIWLMEASATEQRDDIAFGRELRGLEIDALRVPGDPYAAYRSCGLMSPDRCMAMAHAYSHGAAVAALAGGHLPSDEKGRQFPLLGVSLPRSVIAETSGSLSVLFIQAAVIFIIARARALALEISKGDASIKPPLVVNLSLGVTAGAEDGRGALTRLQDAIGNSIPGLGPIHFVLPAGNHRQDCLRAKLYKGKSIGWNIPPGDPTPNAIEIWAAENEQVPKLAIEMPSGSSVDIPLSSSGMGFLQDAKGNRIGRVVLQKRGRDRERFCYTVILPPTLPKKQDDPCAPPGLWGLHIKEAGSKGCNLVIHRDDRLPGMHAHGLQSRLVDEKYSRRTENGRWTVEDPESADKMQAPMIRRNGTISAYARGETQIRVGATFARPPGQISPYSGLLPDAIVGDASAPQDTRPSRTGDVTAPADASASRTGMNLPTITPAGRQRLSGTSLSAPQVTRWLAAALATEEKDIPNRKAFGEAIREAVGDGNPPDLGIPKLPWGHGLGD